MSLSTTRMSVLVLATIVACLAQGAVAADAPPPPVVILQDNPVGTLQRPDGSFAFYNVRGPRTPVIRPTAGGGEITLEPAIDFDLPAGTTRQRLQLDPAGELHEVYLEGRGEGRSIAVDRFIDLWHRQTVDGRSRWQEPQCIWKGYCGALMHFSLLPGGRWLVPFGAWLPHVRTGPPSGPNVVTAVLSDDGGQTWRQSPARLVAPCYADYNGSNYGACEPAVLPLADGRLWMLMRTQAGFLYESHSADNGETWDTATASQFYSSSGPPGLLRLPDGRIVAFWNDCEMPPKVDGAGVYGGRDALHAAISADDGQTWRGFREVYRDASRNDTPPKSGDRGTAYPFAAFDAGGDIILESGQGTGRRNLVKLDPDWLLETTHADDFSGGLEAWHVFKPFGPASGYWRDRTTGAVLAAHPTHSGAQVLHLRRPDLKSPDGATWNFPAGWQGELTVRLWRQPGCQGASLALGDRMFEPTDDNGERLAIFRLDIDDQGRSNGGRTLEPGVWHELTYRWDLDRGTCALRVDGAEQQLAQRCATHSALCYLRLRSTAQTVDDAGFYVESVRATVAAGPAPRRTVTEKLRFEQEALQHVERNANSAVSP